MTITTVYRVLPAALTALLAAGACSAPSGTVTGTIPHTVAGATPLTVADAIPHTVTGTGTTTAATTTAAATATTATTASPAPASAAVAPLSISDSWVKTARSGMSAAFATLVNTTDEAVTVVAASTPVSSSVELHEVVGDGGSTTMRRKQGGFVIPAGGRHVLQPGGDHIMLMGVRTAVEPGTEVPFTLTLKDGRTVSFMAVAKDFAGANESYASHE
ncbi:copper chaperone PCu(A)C [Microbispora bryophytorum]|uniref:copper chaperone PCu(A)C n=1 Tax=Microbispora bryophytorum TaxID=1460882 RepID=UPI0037131717